MARNRKSTISSTDVLLSVLALLLVGVSFWQTFLGLDQLFGKASLFIALILALLLLYLAYTIRQHKKAGKSVVGLSFTYCFVALFCFAANFNAIYTRFMKKEIYLEEMTRVRDTFPDMVNQVEAQLNYNYDPKVRADIRDLQTQLRIQIVDPQNAGIGPEARKLITKIEGKLGKTLTPLTPKSKDVEGYKDLARRMSDQISDLIDNLSQEERDLQAENKKKSAMVTKQLNEGIDNVDFYIDSDDGKSLFNKINQAIASYNSQGRKSEIILNGKYQHQVLTTDISQVGKISYTFRHAFEYFGITTMLVLAGCLLLDFMLLLLVLLLSDQERSNNTAEPAYRNVNRGRTII